MTSGAYPGVMASDEHEGGDPACWSHLFDGTEVGAVVDLTELGKLPGPGVVWSATGSRDLNVNLVRLPAGEHIDEHRNDEVDVLVVVLSGSGEITIDDKVHPITGQQALMIPAGRRRSISAAGWDLSYLSIHRARGPLSIKG